MKKLKTIDWLMIIFMFLIIIGYTLLKDIHEPAMRNMELNGYPM